MLVGHFVRQTGGGEPPGEPHLPCRHERRSQCLELGAVFAITVQRELEGHPPARQRLGNGDHVVEPLLCTA